MDDNKDKKNMYIIIFIGSLIGTIAVLGLLLLFVLQNVIIDQRTINLLDMYIKASFSFFGSIFSIGTSIFIFHLQNNRRFKEEEKNKKQLLKFVQKKNQENLVEVNKIYKIISKKGIEGFLADFQVKEKEIKEIFLTIYTAINVNSLDAMMIKLDPTNSDELKLIEKYNLISEIKNLLVLILEKAETEQGKNELIKKIFSLTEQSNIFSD